MNARYAPWVEPIAARYRASREEAIRLARTLGDAELQLPTADAGWRVRDELAHVASDAAFVEMLGAIVRGERPNTSPFADIDAANARNIAEWRDRRVTDIAGALESNGARLQGLLARLAPDAEALVPDGLPFALKDLLGGNSQHDAYHLQQIHRALEAKAAT